MNEQERQLVIARITAMWDDSWMPEELELELADIPDVEDKGLYGILMDLGGNVSDITKPW
jgi:hypothetical protein